MLNTTLSVQRLVKDGGLAMIHDGDVEPFNVRATSGTHASRFGSLLLSRDAPANGGHEAGGKEFV